MSGYPSKQDTAEALTAVAEAADAIARARHALRTEQSARDQLDEAARLVAGARQVACSADDFHRGRLTWSA